MKAKIVNIQKKAAGIDINEENEEENMMIEEIGYVKKNIKILDAEYSILIKDH